MARPDAEHEAWEDAEGDQPDVGTDPMSPPREDEKEREPVTLDEEKVAEAEQERAERDESPEERAARIKNA